MKLRVLSSDLKRWLCAEVPFAIHPQGDHAEQYRVLWDSSMTSIVAARQKYSAVPGYAGLALTKHGLGARYEMNAFNAARQSAGLLAGDLYYLTGAPRDLLESDIKQLLLQMKWDASVIADSRRVRGPSASYRIRSAQEPPECALRVTFGDTIATMQVSKAAKRETTKPERTDEEPTTWAQVAKQTLGTTPKAGPSQKAPESFGPQSVWQNQPQEHSQVPFEDDSLSSQSHESEVEQLWKDMEQDEIDNVPLDHLPDFISSYQAHRQVREPGAKPKKRPRLIQGKQMPAWKATSGSSKQRVMKVEAEVASLKESIHDLIAKLHVPVQPPPMSHPNVQRASIPFSNDIGMAMITTAKVAGDGACLWHSLCACVNGFQSGTEIDPNPGHAFKTSMLRLFTDHLQQCAQVIGVEPMNMQRILQEWTPHAEWADARLIALIASHYRANVIVFNQADGCLEAITSSVENLSTCPWWILRYTGDHYEPAMVVDRPKLQAACAALEFTPWKPQRQGGGGASLDSPTTTMGRPIRCTTWNAGGWKSHEQTMRMRLRENQGGLVLVQETHLTTDGQRSAAYLAKDFGYDCCWGAAASLNRCKDGTLRTSWGCCPGVGVLADSSLGMCQVPPATKVGREWWERGRLLLCRILALASPLLIICAYAPSGHEKAMEREQFLTDLYQELSAHRNQAYILGADWNTHPIDNALVGQLIEAGAGIPQWIDPSGHETETTYWSGASESFLDGFVVGPDAYSTPQQLVEPVAGSPHGMVTIQIFGTPRDPITRVRPTVHLKAKQQQTPQLAWHAVHAEVGAILAPLPHLVTTGREDQVQDCIDAAWSVCLTHYRMHVLKSHDTVDRRGEKSDPRHLGMMNLPSLKREPDDKTTKRARMTKPPCPTQQERVQRHIHRLIALAQNPLCAKARQRLLKDVPFLSFALRMTAGQIQADVDNPGSAISKWVTRLRAFTERSTRQDIARWKATLAEAGRPHPRLYRWLRGQVPLPGMVIGDANGTHIGPEDTFRALRRYWGDIMGADLHTESALREWAQRQPVLTEHLANWTAQDVLNAAKSMRLASVGGMDGWPVGALRCLTSEICDTLLCLWRACTHAMTWPTSMLFIRTQVIPKKANSWQVDNLRPISIMAIWYRLWGRVVLEKHSHLLERLDPHLRGGVPGRGISDTVLQWALKVESAVHGVPEVNSEQPQEVYVLSIDAVKCFDRIQQGQALEEARTFGFDPSCLRLLAGFYKGARRVLSYSGALDLFSFHPGRGVPQGCALSACLCNILVSGWARRMRQHGVIPGAFLDDRTICADQPGPLLQAWQESLAWDSEYGWLSHQQKTCLAFAPRNAAPPELMHSLSKPVRTASSIQTLGHDVPFRYQQHGSTQDDRTQKAIRSCKRIEVLRLPTPLSQQLVASVTMKQFSFGFQSVPTPVRHLKALGSAIRSATATKARRHAWTALAALVQKPDYLDPKATAVYQHPTSLIRHLREGDLAWPLWCHLRGRNLGRRPQGPRAVTSQYLRLLQITESPDSEQWSKGECHLSIRTADWPAVKHQLRVWLREWLLRKASLSRANLAGAADIDIKTSTQLWKSKTNCPRDLLVSMMCDGIWSHWIRYKAGWEESGACPMCGGERGDVAHIIHECSRWKHLRKGLQSLAGWFNAQSLATRACLLCPTDCSPVIRRGWVALQLEALSILGEWGRQARLVVIPKSKSDSGVPEDQPRDIASATWAPLQQHWFANSQRYDFELCSCRTRGKRQWMYSIPQWQRLCLYMSQVRVVTEDVPDLHLSVLEVYVSYVIWGDGQRFESQLPTGNRGHWLSTQLEPFREALLSWNHITMSPPLFPEGQRQGEQSGWGSRLSLPRFQLTLMPLLVPCLQAARQWINEMPRHIYGVREQCAPKEAWRRVPLGREDSQMSIGGDPETIPPSSLSLHSEEENNCEETPFEMGNHSARCPLVEGRNRWTCYGHGLGGGPCPPNP